jgi:putative DNA primase/helicase
MAIHRAQLKAAPTATSTTSRAPLRRADLRIPQQPTQQDAHPPEVKPVDPYLAANDNRHSPLSETPSSHSADTCLPSGITRATAIAPKAIDWLWDGWLAAGKLHILGGSPGAGKTTLAIAMAATVTVGGNWPDGSGCCKGSVAILSREDDTADTLIPRLALAGANLNRVLFIKGIGDLNGLVKAVNDVRMLIIDPIVSTISGTGNNNVEVRRELQPIVDFAAKHGIAILGITHFSKGTSRRDPVERITGSLAFAALARVVLVAALNQKNGDEERPTGILCRAKGNNSASNGGIGYQLLQGETADWTGVRGSYVQWGDQLHGATRDLLSAAEVPVDQGKQEALADEKDFLRTLLAEGAVPVPRIQEEMKNAGLSWASIRRAKDAIGVTARKSGMKEGWVWELPEGAH